MDDRTEVDGAPDEVLDGNALAGMLTAAFGVEMTEVPGRCTHCGVVTMIGELRAYVRAPGATLRCPACDEIVLRVVETIEATYVDARGAMYLRFDHR